MSELDREAHNDDELWVSIAIWNKFAFDIAGKLEIFPVFGRFAFVVKLENEFLSIS